MKNKLGEPAVAYGKSKFTSEEYFQMEETSEEKHEYYQGKYLLCGATGNNKIKL